MVNLVKYRKIFIIASLIVMIPGVISLFIWGLNVGIDFTGGSRVAFRPRTPVTQTQIENVLEPFKLEHQHVVFGENPGLDSKKMVWQDFTVWVDSTVQKDIENRLKQKFGSEIILKWTELTDKDKRVFSQLSIANFKEAPKAEDITATLKDLPKTSDPSKGDPATPTSTPTPETTGTPQATATPQVTATATPQATTTPQATETPAADNPANITVEAKGEPRFGQTNDTFEILVPVITISTTKAENVDLTVAEIQSAFQQAGLTDLYLISSTNVGGAVAGDTVRNSILAVAAVSVFIMLYIWFSFRKIPRAARYGITAITAMIHDTIVVLGLFSLLGRFFDVQIDALFITALLTVIGFSVHDTIVVFDRVRENMSRRTNETFADVVNVGMLQTMTRSLNTSLTVLFALFPLVLFSEPGTSIHTFVLTLLIGLASGTYSSIFNASMLVVMWDKGEWFFKYLGKSGYDRPDGPKREVRERTGERELARS